MWYHNIRNALFGFVTKHARDRQTDRQTDGKNYDSNTASIAAHGVKTELFDIVYSEQFAAVCLWLALYKCVSIDWIEWTRVAGDK